LGSLSHLWREFLSWPRWLVSPVDGASFSRAGVGWFLQSAEIMASSSVRVSLALGYDWFLQSVGFGRLFYSSFSRVRVDWFLQLVAQSSLAPIFFSSSRSA
jgi:hypothetical protein